MSDTRAKHTLSPTRRTLVKGAAWTAPAIVVMSAAPAYAATRPPVAPPPDSFGCKYPGNSDPWEKSYRVELCFLNSTDEQVSVTINSLTWRGAAPTFPPTGSTNDLFFDPQHCLSDGADGDLVADSCATFKNPYTFTIPAASGSTPGQTCFWIFWRGDASAQNDMCFNYTYTGSAGTTTASACTTIHFDPDCNCTSPQPPYAKDHAGC